MNEIPNCPKCASEYCYEDGNMFMCPMCNHEFSGDEEPEGLIKDSNGNVLQDGDTVTVIKDLKVNGSSSVIKVGTKVKGIRLAPDSKDDHDINCTIPGFGKMSLKSSVVKKS